MILIGTFALLSLLMIVFSLYLLSRIKVYYTECTEGLNTLSEESKTIGRIVFVFGVSYLVRFIYDFDGIVQQ